MRTLTENRKGKQSLSLLIPYVGLIAVFLLFLIWSKGAILTITNLAAIINQAYNIMLIGTGAIFVYAYGGLDFSLGALMGVCTMILTVLVKADVPVVVGIAVVVGIGLFSGFLAGIIHRKFGLPIFIVTLSLSYIWGGLQEYGCRGGLMYLPKEFIATFNSWGMKIVVLIVFMLLSYYFFNYNRFGKNMKAIGGNPTVAELNGIPVTKCIVFAHMVAGLCVAIASIFSLARAGSCNATAGAGVQMDVMIGLVLGGVPMTGGVKSKSSAIIIGGLITAILSNGLLICGVNPYAVEGLTGAVFIIVVAMKTKRTAASILS